MSGFLAIFRREFGGRRQILYAAGFGSLIPLLLPVFRRMAAGDVAEARGWSALIVSAGFAVGLPAALGASLLVPRIATRRIAFDFARPVSGAVIWLGSLAAAAALALSTAAIVWIPALLAGARLNKADLFSDRWAWGLAALLVVAALPVIFSMLHAMALIKRSRSVLLALDAAMWSLCIVGTSTAVSRLPNYFAHGPRTRCLLWLGAATAIALLAAGQASVTRGRIDVRAAHRALSITLWTLIFAAVLVANGYAEWVMAASPEDLRAAKAGFDVMPAAKGPWVQLSASARGADARFVWDTAGGRFARTQTFDWRGPLISRDGARAAWIEGSDGRGPSTIRYWRLDDPTSRPVVTRLPGTTDLFELSADGSRVAAWENGNLSIYDLDAQRTLASARLPVGHDEKLSGVFVGRDVFRLRRSGDASIDLIELEVTHRTLTTVGRIEVPKALRFSFTDADGSRILTESGLHAVASSMGRTAGRWPRSATSRRKAAGRHSSRTAGSSFWSTLGRTDASLSSGRTANRKGRSLCRQTRHAYGSKVRSRRANWCSASPTRGFDTASTSSTSNGRPFERSPTTSVPICLGRPMPDLGSDGHEALLRSGAFSRPIRPADRRPPRRFSA